MDEFELGLVALISPLFASKTHVFAEGARVSVVKRPVFGVVEPMGPGEVKSTDLKSGIRQARLPCPFQQWQIYIQQARYNLMELRNNRQNLT